MPTASLEKQNGVVYTESPLIEFILDRVGYRGPVFEKQPTFYDPSVGTGGFLLAAAKRVLDWSLAQNRPPAETVQHILSCHVGSEIDPRAYETALENLQTLIAPVHTDTLKTTCPQPELFLADSLSFFHPTTPLQGHRLFADDQFDFCVGNPPYIGEKGNKALFQNLLLHYPAWRPYYQGKMDYLYFFILLGISKLKAGGKLGFITTRYWLTADGASILRNEILHACKILELIDLGHNSAFRQASGQQNLIVILEKCGNPEQRRQHLPKWVLADTTQLLKLYKQDPNTVHHWIDQTQCENNTVQVFTSAIPQGDWESFIPSGKQQLAKPWHMHQSSTEEALLEKIRQAGVPLSEVLIDQQGVISGADKVTAQNIRFLEPETIEHHSIQPGEGIFCLAAGELQQLVLNPNEQAQVKPFFKNSHIKPYAVSLPQDLEFLLYLTSAVSLKACPTLGAHLTKFKNILQRKRECLSGQIPWYSLHWPRQQALLEAPAIVTPRRAPKNCFALSPAGYYKNSDITLLVLRPDIPEDLRYFLALLNSPVLDFWMSRRGKPKGKMREYYATPLRQLPLKRLDLSNPTERQQHDAIVSITQQLIEAQAKNYYQLKQQLDQHVLELYRLTPEEKKLL